MPKVFIFSANVIQKPLVQEWRLLTQTGAPDLDSCFASVSGSVECNLVFWTFTRGGSRSFLRATSFPGLRDRGCSRGQMLIDA
jgi:hypothetical protein